MGTLRYGKTIRSHTSSLQAPPKSFTLTIPTELAMVRTVIWNLNILLLPLSGLLLPRAARGC